MKKYNNQKKNSVGIYLWKLIFIIIAIFVIVLSIECFLLVERTVKEIISASSEEYNTSMIAENQEISEETGEDDDSTNSSTNNVSEENDNTNIITDDLTNTVTNMVSNTVTDIADTNTIETNAVEVVDILNTNTINTEQIVDEKDIIIEEKLVCKKIHEHQKICYLEQYTEEDRESVFLVIQMIDELPEFDIILEKLNKFEEVEDDEGYSEYYLKITEQIKHIYSYYDTLKNEEKDLRVYVTNSEKLLNLYNICETDEMALQTHVIVQYYANIERVARGPEIENLGDVYHSPSNFPYNTLAIIDTSAEKNGVPTLPKNGTGRSNTPVNSKIQSILNDPYTNLIQYNMELTEVYNSKEYDIEGTTKLETLNRFDGRDKGYYDLIEIWVLKKGCSPTSIKRDDWNIYYVKNNNELYFTNDLNDLNKNKIYLNQGDVVRYVCDAEKGSYDNASLLYDYDITNGVIYDTWEYAKYGTEKGSSPTSSQTNTKVWYAHTNESGINSLSNYAESGSRIAFGSNSTGTGLRKRNLERFKWFI